MISRHLNVPPPKLAAQRPELAAFDPVISAAMAKNPEDRFQSCQDFAHALNQRISTRSGDGHETQAAIPLPRPAPPSSSIETDQIPSRRPPWRRPVIAVATLIAVLLVTGAFVAFIKTRHHNLTAGAPSLAIQTPEQPPRPSQVSGTAQSSGPPLGSAPSTPPSAPSSSSTAPRVEDATGSFSFVMPPGWIMKDPSKLHYGSVLLNHGAANDMVVLLGRLENNLYAYAQPDDTKSAIQLSGDMGTYFFPFPGTRINRETIPLNAGDVPGAANYYEVNFDDTSKPSAQIWSAVIGSGDQRFFVVWLGTVNDPVDKAAGQELAESIRSQ